MDKTITEKTGGRSARRIRSGGRSANTARRGKELFKQSSWRLPVNHDPPTVSYTHLTLPTSDQV